MLVGPLARALVPVELAEAEVAVGDDRAHAARFGERERLAIMGLTELGIELIGVGCDVAEELQRMGSEPGLARREFERAIAQTPCVFEPAQHQRGPPQPGIEPSESTGLSAQSVALEKLLAFPQPAQGFARVVEQRQAPGGEADREGKQGDDVPCPEDRRRMLDSRARPRPVAPQQMDPAYSQVSPADSVGVLCLRREPERLRFELGRFGEAAKLGQADDQSATIVDRWRSGEPEILRGGISRQQGQVLGGKDRHAFVLAAVEMHLLEDGRGGNDEFQVTEAPGDLQRLRTGGKRFVQLTEQRVNDRREAEDPAAPAVVVKTLGEDLRFLQALQRPPDSAELDQRLWQFEADIEGLLERGRALRQRREGSQRPIEEFDSLAVGPSRVGKPARLDRIVDRLTGKAGLGAKPGDERPGHRVRFRVQLTLEEYDEVLIVLERFGLASHGGQRLHDHPMRVLTQGIQRDGAMGDLERGLRACRVQRLPGVPDHGVERQAFQPPSLCTEPIRPGLLCDIHVGQQRPLVEVSGRGERSTASFAAQRLEPGHIAIDHTGCEPHFVAIAHEGIVAQCPAQPEQCLAQVLLGLGLEMRAPKQGRQLLSRLWHGGSAGQICQQAGKLLVGQLDGSFRPGQLEAHQ